MSVPTAKEIEILPRFRASLQDLNLDAWRNSDAQLLRWLRARDLDLKKAEEMLRHSMKWRKDQDVDNCKNWKFPDVIYSTLPFEISGYTENNSPVFIIPMGLFDLKKLFDMGKKEETMKYLIAMFELFVNDSKEKINPKTKYPVTQVVVVVDCDKYTYAQLASPGTVSMILDLVKVFDLNYPEMLESAVLVKAPKIFLLLFAMIRQLLNQRTQEKISIFSHDEKKWKPFLSNLIPLEALPPKYGGIAVSSVVNHKGEKGVKYRKIEEIDITQGEMLYVETDDSKHTFDVDAGAQKKIVFETIDPNQSIAWKINVEKNDIGYTIVDGNNKEVIKYKKTTEGAEEKGTYVCEIPGIYYVHFDNTYSLVRGKSVSFQIKSEAKTVVEAMPVRENLLPSKTSK